MRRQPFGIVYLLHFAEPISPEHTCQHYIGFTELDLADRMQQHRAGLGARLTQVANERGIAYQVLRSWDHVTRQTERRLKNRKNARLLCPICNPQGYLNHARQL